MPAESLLPHLYGEPGGMASLVGQSRERRCTLAAFGLCSGARARVAQVQRNSVSKPSP
jgi:hypothetical protein